MKLIRTFLMGVAMAMAAAGAAAQASQSAQGPDLGQFTQFTGDTKLACEAIMCLSTGAPPSQCQPSLQRYFTIVTPYSVTTINERLKFLNQCPAASYDTNMQTLVMAIAQGAGQCSPGALNSALKRYDQASQTWLISDKLPAACAALIQHVNADLKNSVRYVGVPERGGKWVAPADYERELQAYQARVAAEDEEARKQAEAAKAEAAAAAQRGDGV